jgi:hypothetical protein
MLLKIYAFTWAVMIAMAGMLFATGMLNEFTITALGFIFPTMFFVGLFGVLPWMMDRHYARHIVEPTAEPADVRKRTTKQRVKTGLRGYRGTPSLVTA